MSFLLAPIEGALFALAHFARTNELAAIVGVTGGLAVASSAFVFVGASRSGILSATDTDGVKGGAAFTLAELRKNEAASAEHWGSWGEERLREARARRLA